MRTKKVVLVFKKDWLEIRRNWQVILPMVLIPFTFSILLPVLLIGLPSLSTLPETSSAGLETMIKTFPNSVREELAQMTDKQAIVYIISQYFFAPFFLIIPLMASSVVASDSFAGEKERKTIEALLATPLSDSELFLGKVLVSFVPSMIVTIISFLIYSAVVDASTISLFNGRFLIPNPVWIMLILGLAPTLALASIGLTLTISARVKGLREAQQISAFLLVPILALIFAQLFGAIVMGSSVVAALIGLFLGIDIIVLKMGLRTFKREEILSRIA